MRRLRMPGFIWLFSFIAVAFVVLAKFGIYDNTFLSEDSIKKLTWTDSVGKGLASPACGSSSACGFSGEGVVCLACSGTAPQVDFDWIDDGNTAGYTCQTAWIRVNTGAVGSNFIVAQNLPCSGSYSWTGGNSSTHYNYFIRYQTAIDDATGNLINFGFDASPSTFFTDNFDQGGSGLTNGWASIPGGSSPSRVISASGFTVGQGGTKGFYFQGSNNANPDDGARRTVNISNKDFLVIKYSRATASLLPGETFFIQYSFDGTTFTTLEALTGNRPYAARAFPVNNPNADPNITIKIFINANSGNAKAAIDNFEIVGTNTGHLISGGSFDTPGCLVAGGADLHSVIPDSAGNDVVGDVIAGTSLEFAGQVENLSGTDSSVPSVARICIDNANCLNNNANALGEFAVGALAPLDSAPDILSNPWILPNGAGAHTYYVCADVYDTNSPEGPPGGETNNCASFFFQPVQCGNGIDDDGDGLVDCQDSGCHSDGNAGNAASCGVAEQTTDDNESNNPACADGIDNDSDGVTDFPADGGCGCATCASEVAQCQDLLDNDGDGRIDDESGVNDPGCHSDGNPNNPASYNPNDNDERDQTFREIFLPFTKPFASIFGF